MARHVIGERINGGDERAGELRVRDVAVVAVLSPVRNARRRQPLGEHDFLECVAAIDLRQADAEVSGARVVGDGRDADNDIQPMLVVGHAVGVANRRPIKGIVAGPATTASGQGDIGYGAAQRSEPQ